MSMADCPHFPDCGHRGESQCDSDAQDKRPTIPVWTPVSSENVANCLANSLKRAGQALRSTGHAGDAIDASRIEWLRLQILTGVMDPAYSSYTLALARPKAS